MLGEGSSGRAKTEIGFRGGQRAIDHDEPGPGPGGQDEVRQKIKQNEPFTRLGVPCTRLVYMHVILRYNTHTHTHPKLNPSNQQAQHAVFQPPHSGQRISALRQGFGQLLLLLMFLPPVFHPPVADAQRLPQPPGEFPSALVAPGVWAWRAETGPEWRSCFVLTPAYYP